MTIEEYRLVDYYVKEIAECGSKKALTELFLIMHKRLYQHLLKFIKDSYEIEDIIMDTFEVIIKKSYKMLFFKNCYKWILKTAEKVMSNRFKKNGKRNELLKHIPIETHIKFNEANLLLNVEIKKLPLYYQYLIFYKFRCKLKVEEIATMFKKSRATIFRDINEVLDILKEKLS